MRLAEKGAIVPPPPLSPHLQAVADSISGGQGIIAATHWDLYQPTKPDGVDFYVGEEELGHIHLNGDVHLATSDELRKLIAKGLAQRFPYGGSYACWVLFHIRSDSDARQALWLFELNYQRLTGTHLPKILEQIENYK